MMLLVVETGRGKKVKKGDGSLIEVVYPSRVLLEKRNPDYS